MRADARYTASKPCVPPGLASLVALLFPRVDRPVVPMRSSGSMAQRRSMSSPHRDGSATRISRRTVLKGTAVAMGALLLDKSGMALARGAGQSTAVSSYVLPSLPEGIVLTPILTVGDSAGNGYRMVGIPDGLGAVANGQTFSLFMNHELGRGSGIVRRHGSIGA